MCGGRRARGCCGGRRRGGGGPLLLKAAVAGGTLAYNAYNNRKEKKALEQNGGSREAYPETLNAQNEQYGAVPPVPAYADANATYLERDDKSAPIPTNTMEAEASRSMPPPAYTEVAPAAAPIAMSSEADEYATRNMYPQQPQQQQPVYSQPAQPHGAMVARPAMRRRGSSVSSISSVSSVSSMRSEEEAQHSRNFVAGNVTPILPQDRYRKRLYKHGRKHLRRSLKRSPSLNDATLVVLGTMGTLLKIDPGQMNRFAATQGMYFSNSGSSDRHNTDDMFLVDPSTALMLSQWAAKAAKSKVHTQDLMSAGTFGNAAGVIAAHSKKVKAKK